MEEELLIEAIRDFPVIYDVTSALYHNLNLDKREAAWRSVAERTKCSGMKIL